MGKGVIKEQKWASKFGCDQFTLKWQLTLGASEPLKAVSAWFPRCFHGLLLSMARTWLAVWGRGGLCLLAPPGSGLPHSRHRQRCPWALLAGQEGAGRGHVVKEGGELWHAFKNYSLKNCFLKQRKVIEGTIFLYFLIKCHLLAEKQLAVSCTAGG